MPTDKKKGGPSAGDVEAIKVTSCGHLDGVEPAWLGVQRHVIKQVLAVADPAVVSPALLPHKEKWLEVIVCPDFE